MRLQVQLVHAETGARVVLVSAWSGSECLGSALGEAADAEEAERRAEGRLRARLAQAVDDVPAAAQGSAAPPPATRAAAAGTDPAPAMPPSSPAPPLRRVAPVPVEPLPGDPVAAVPAPATNPSGLKVPVHQQRLPDPGPDPVHEPSPDPEDWSDDLARIDLEVQRLGWDRHQEATYLERAFGHPSRSRLTRYGDLVAYLQALAVLEAGADAALVPLPLRRRDLLEQCDELLRHLRWDPEQGRLFLELHFQCSSRQHLSDQQLLQFNMLLEEQWLQQTGAVSPQ